MIYTVTFNPALDYTLFVDEIGNDDINRAKSETLDFGGKGINVSAVLTRLGIENTALGFSAGFSGNELERMLTDEGISNDFVHLNNGYTRINVKIRSDRELDFNASGPKISENDSDKLFEKLTRIKKNDYLVLAGSVPDSLPCDIYEKILEFLKKRECNIVVDATGDLLLRTLKYKPFMIKPNHFELGDLFSVKLSSDTEIIKYAKILQEKGARNVLVSCGENGAILLDENTEIHKADAVRGKLVSSVGCGDSMVAGFLAGYTEKQDYAYALRLGCACGSATAFCTGLAQRKDIDEILNVLPI